jgi:hypothetical protein
LQKNEPEKPVAVVVNNDTTDLKKDTLVTAKGNALGNENALPITLKTDSTGDQNQADLIAKTNSEKASKTDSTLTAPGDQKPDITYGDVIKKAPITEPEKQPLVFTPAKKYMSKKGSDGMEMIYIDPNQDENDTVRIFIPSEKIVIKPAADNNSVVHNENPVYPLQDTSASVKSAAIEQPKEISSNTNDTTTSLSSLNFIENINSIKNKEGGLEKKDDAMNPMIDHENSGVKQPETKNDFQKNNIVVLPQVVQSSTTNSDCKAFANNEDFLRLRKKMASENNDDQMIKIAKKYFHTKCFSIEQIKNLSFLFLSNEGKYRFFDVAYPFSSDSEQYKMLQSQLTDSYYINRFKAMIHK